MANNVCSACGGDDRHVKCPKGGRTFTEAFREIERINLKNDRSWDGMTDSEAAGDEATWD